MIIKFYKNDKLEQGCEPCFSFFPDGQPHVKVTPKTWEGFDRAEIHCSIRNPLELFQFNMVWEVVKKHFPFQTVSSHFYWFFGSRMDRAIDENQPSTALLALGGLPYYSFPRFFLDLHNPALSPYSQNIPLEPILEAVLTDFGSCDIYFPDAGAKKRYVSLFQGYNVLCGKKKRDSQTGKLSGFELAGGERKSDKIIIIDDICDGGGTFLGQLPTLKALGYAQVGLYTTHGLYTKGMEVLKDFNEIYSTNSFEFGLPYNYFRIRKWYPGRYFEEEGVVKECSAGWIILKTF